MSINQRPHREELLVDIDFNVVLDATEGNARYEEIDASLNTVGVEDMGFHLFPRSKPWLRDREMWSILRGGKEVRY